MYKNIVVIGGGFAGVHAAKALQSAKLGEGWRIIVVEKREFAHTPWADLRASVVPGEGWEDKAVHSYDGLFPSGSPHVLLAGNEVVEIGEREIQLRRPVEGTDLGNGPDHDKVSFEYLVLATGSYGQAPFDAKGDVKSENFVNSLRTVQEEVARANSILIVGGGPVGVEFAGEVTDFYDGKGRPAKEITLVDSHERLLPNLKPSVSQRALRVLESRGVHVHLGVKADIHGLQSGPQGEKRRIGLSNGKDVEADYVLVSRGGAVPNNALVEKFGRDMLDANGRVKVRPTLQSEKYDHIFVVGDMTGTDEPKAAIPIRDHAKVVANNVGSLILGRGATAEHKPASFTTMLLPFGKRDGFGQIFGWTPPIFMIVWLRKMALESFPKAISAKA